MAEPSPAPIFGELRDAFEQAIGQYSHWRRGESEPVVSLDMRPVLISTICDAVSKFEALMPDGLWHHLAMVTPGGEDLPNDRSYQSAARFLAHLIREKKADFERLNQADQ
jgi:hypothetical protein